MQHDEENQVLARYLSQVAAGDRDALHKVYKHTSPKLYGLCLRILGSKAEADDTLQDVFIKIWHKAEQFDAEHGRAIGWLSTMARNTALDRIRARKPDTSIDVHEAATLTQLVDDAPGPEDMAKASQTRLQLETCLEQLDEKHAKAVRAAYLEGFSYQELATALSVPLNTMRTWLRRSLLSLRDCLSVDA